MDSPVIMVKMKIAQDIGQAPNGMILDVGGNFLTLVNIKQYQSLQYQPQLLLLLQLQLDSAIMNRRSHGKQQERTA